MHTLIHNYSAEEKYSDQIIYRIKPDIVQHPFFSPRKRNAHKGHFGKLLLVGGHAGMGGAIRLSGEAAMRMGTGLVVAATHTSNQMALTTARPELMTQALGDANDLNQRLFWCDRIGLGPGLGRNTWSQSIFDRLYRDPKLAVIDADALYWLAQKKEILASVDNAGEPTCIITPHAGEAAYLLSCSSEDVEEDRIHAVKLLAQQYGVIAVLKGHHSLISDGEYVFMVTAGNPGMATAGMGDVLTGIISALVVQGVSVLDAASIGVWLHATAGDLAADEFGEKGLLASDLFPYVRQIINGKQK